MALAKYDLEAGGDGDTTQVKGGVDLTLHPIHWLGIMMRYDGVKAQGLDMAGAIVDKTFHVLTLRIILSSHLTVPGTIYLQYSYYIFGDNIWLDEAAEMRPDQHAVKLCAKFGGRAKKTRMRMKR